MKLAKNKRYNKLLFVNTFRKFTKQNKAQQRKKITHLITFIETHQ